MKCKICNGVLILKHKALYDNRHGYPEKFDIYACTDCGFMQTSPQLSPGKLSDIYTKYYPKRDANIKELVASANKIPTKDEIQKNGWGTTCHFQTKRGQKVLDIGCGTCQSLLEIKKLGGEAWGIEVDKNSQKVAQKLKLKFHLGTIHDCEFPEKYFDLITASQVLEHEPDPIKFLKDCKKFLKPGGKIILSFPNTDSFYRKVFGKNWLHWHLPYHLNHFNNKSVKLLAQKSELRIISLKTVTPNLWIILQIRLLINNPKMGHRDPMWDPGLGKARDEKQSFFQKTTTRFLSAIQSLLFVNRLIDSLRLGESFVVTLGT